MRYVAVRPLRSDGRDWPAMHGSGRMERDRHNISAPRAVVAVATINSGREFAPVDTSVNVTVLP